mmetsp:Transcript_28482/g.53386  ORF Transcript_28482/g.53386 Transcript_28482/m.53386 type:complete len:301 (-) Transcript_28482:6269-7171(-)
MWKDCGVSGHQIDVPHGMMMPRMIPKTTIPADTSFCSSVQTMASNMVRNGCGNSQRNARSISITLLRCAELSGGADHGFDIGFGREQLPGHCGGIAMHRARKHRVRRQETDQTANGHIGQGRGALQNRRIVVNGDAMGLPEQDAARAGKAKDADQAGAQHNHPDPRHPIPVKGRVQHQQFADKPRERRQARHRDGPGKEQGRSQCRTCGRGLGRQVQTAPPRPHQIRDQEQRRTGQRGMHNVVERRRDAFGCKERDRHHHHAHRSNDREGDKAVQLFRRQHANHADGQRNQRRRQQPHVM